MSLQQMFDRCPDGESPSGTFEVHWSRKGTGVGGFYFYIGEDGKVHCSSECMSPEFVRGVLNDLVDHAIFDDFKDRTPLKIRDVNPKKPVVIDAEHYTGENQEFIEHFVGMKLKRQGDALVIPTLESEHIASPGDYIIKGVKGELYPCKPDIFAATYECVAVVR